MRKRVRLKKVPGRESVFSVCGNSWVCGTGHVQGPLARVIRGEGR